jgi:hypothetical protein
MPAPLNRWPGKTYQPSMTFEDIRIAPERSLPRMPEQDYRVRD